MARELYYYLYIILIVYSLYTIYPITKIPRMSLPILSTAECYLYTL